MIWGKTTEQKLWKYERHTWFAWRPVKLNNGRWVWCEWIWQQKKTGKYSSGNGWNRDPLCGNCALRFSCEDGSYRKHAGFKICPAVKDDGRE